jgi:hypothetical protein
MIQKLCSTCLHMPTSTRDAPCKDCLRFNEANLIDNWTPQPGAAARRVDVSNPATPVNPLDVQVAGGHYKGKAIQPVEYISANKLNFLEGCIVKRITRWRDKPAEHRFQDLEKIKHEVDLLIEMEKRHG